MNLFFIQSHVALSILPSVPFKMYTMALLIP